MIFLESDELAKAELSEAYDRNADPRIDFVVRVTDSQSSGATIKPQVAAHLIWKLEGVLKGFDLDNYRKVREMHTLADELAAKPTGRPFAFEMYRRLGLDPETMPPLDPMS